jgi:hypothetical protein
LDREDPEIVIRVTEAVGRRLEHYMMERIGAYEKEVEEPREDPRHNIQLPSFKTSGKMGLSSVDLHHT